LTAHTPIDRLLKRVDGAYQPINRRVRGQPAPTKYPILIVKNHHGVRIPDQGVIYHESEHIDMNETFKLITIQPPLPCVYHDCHEPATTAIAYAVSEREWRIVPTCKQHSVLFPTNHEQPAVTGKR
jgi:hypothetical protein